MFKVNNRNTRKKLNKLKFFKASCPRDLSHVRFHPGVKFAQGWNYVWLWRNFCNQSHFLPEVKSHPGVISPVLQIGAKFHPGANSVWFQRVTAMNFQPSLILCAMLWFIQKILSHYHYFLFLNNVQMASFGFFFKEAKTQKAFFLWQNKTLMNWYNQLLGSSPGSSSLKWAKKVELLLHASSLVAWPFQTQYSSKLWLLF